VRQGARQFATGVTIVTTRAPPMAFPAGLTVNSFSSVSLDPPLALWCLGFEFGHYDVFRLAST